MAYIFQPGHFSKSEPVPKNFPPPDLDEKVEATLDEDEVCLWRGTTDAQADLIEQNKTAGGVPLLGHQQLPGRPSEEQAKKQAGGFSVKGFKAEDRLPEYTTKQSVARSFSTTIVAISILKKYLTRGSVIEEGWVMFPNAPVTGVMVWRGSPNPTKTKVPNAD